MAADLHLHALGNVTNEDLACFFSCTVGSKWFFSPLGGHPCQVKRVHPCAHWCAVADSDNTWIGEVSWLKAGLVGDLTYVPEPVAQVSTLIGENLPVLTSTLRDQIISAVGTERLRDNGYKTIDPYDPELEQWLNYRAGDRLFTVSW